MNKRNEMSILKTICIFISLACVCAFALVCVWEFGPSIMLWLKIMFTIMFALILISTLCGLVMIIIINKKEGKNE